MQKIYTSTRNKDIKRTPKEAILAGMADDGGLYVYDGLDEVKLPIRDMMEMSYAQMAETILSALLPDFTEEEVKNVYRMPMPIVLITMILPLFILPRMYLFWNCSMDLPVLLKMWDCVCCHN